MAGIEDIIEIYRGENLIDKFKMLREIKKNKWVPGINKIGKFATDKLAHAQDYAGKFPNIIKSAKLPKDTVEFGKRLFDKAHFKQMADHTGHRSRLLMPKKAQEKLKIDILKTIASNAKALTPLALKGLSVVASLPAQVVVMTLAPTEANADEVNMTLEDFAKLAEENQPKEKMATGGKAYSTDIKDYYRRAWGLGDRVPFKYGGTWADWATNYKDQMTFEEYLQDDNIVKKSHFLDRKAEGGVARQPFADENKIRVADPNFKKSNIKPIMVEESKVLEILGIEPGSKEKKSFYTQKYKNKGKFNKLIQITGEPVKSTEGVPGTQHKKTFYNIADLNKDEVKWINDPKSRRIYSDEGRGKLVTQDKNLRKLFIEKYNLGHGPKNIMTLIDPENKLGINQTKYGTDVAEQLIKDGAITQRKGQSLEHKAYTDQKTKNTDLDIEKIAKIYDKNPSGSLERIAHALAGGKANFDKLSPRLQTEFMTKAGRRSFNLWEYLKGVRPSVDKNTNINLKNKDAIFKVLDSSKHPLWPMVKEGDARNYKFAELDALFGNERGTHAKTRNDIHKFLKLNNAPKGLFVIDEGPGLTTALKNGLPILTRFSNLFNKKTNQAKIALDLKLRTVYPILTNLDNGKDKYKITRSDFKKSEIYGWGLKEKDIGKIINKKDHPAIKEYNKFSKSFSKANKVRTPIFKFGNISENLNLDDRRWVTEEAAKELKNMNKKYGFYADNMGTDLKLIKPRLEEKSRLKKIDYTKPQIVLMKLRDGLQDVYNKIPGKAVRLPAGAAAAVLDYNFFHNVMGIPSQEAAIGAATWLVKNKEAAQRIGYALMAVSSGNMEIEEFIKKHGKELVGISQEAVLSESKPQEASPMMWKQGKLEIADEMARGGLSGVDQYILNRYR